MIYLLDANTLIDAKRDYYPMSQFPEFWDWILYQATNGVIKIPIEIYEEFSDSKDQDGNKDELAIWAEKKEVKNNLLFNEEAERHLVSKITYEGYLPNPSDEDIKIIGRDPFLISYALKDKSNRVIVTTEVSKPSKIKANRKIPDVCNQFDVKCINTFTLIRELKFKTNWSK